MVREWWERQNGSVLEQDDLPAHGFIGVLKKTHSPAAVCFLYLSSNSRVAQIGYPMVSPNEMFSSRMRAEALKSAIRGAMDLALSLGQKRIIALCDKTGISGLYEGEGFLPMPHHKFHVFGMTEP